MKILNRLIPFLLFLSVMDVEAQDIGKFMIEDIPKSGYFKCAYKNKTASKKCLVSIVTVKASTVRTKAYFGENGQHDLLKILWPDEDVSQYAILDDFQLWNLEDSNHYNFKQSPYEEFDLDLSKGLIIEGNNHKEYIRIW